MSYESRIGLSKSDALQINKRVMLDQATALIFTEEVERPTHDFKCIEDRHFGVLRALRISTLADPKQSGETLNKRVQLQNGVKESTARKHIIETSSLGLIKETKDPFDNRTSLFHIEDKILQKLDRLAEIEMEVTDVVRAQINDPVNPVAGSEMLSEDIYFNVMHIEAIEAARKALKKMEQKQGDKA